MTSSGGWTRSGELPKKRGVRQIVSWPRRQAQSSRMPAREDLLTSKSSRGHSKPHVDSPAHTEPAPADLGEERGMPAGTTQAPTMPCFETHRTGRRKVALPSFNDTTIEFANEKGEKDPDGET